MASYFSNQAPSQMLSTDFNAPKSPSGSVGNAFKSAAQSTQKKLSSMGTSLLARVLFRQPNFDFLDIPTANPKVVQQEMIEDLKGKKP